MNKLLNKKSKQYSWNIFKRAFLFIFYEAPIFCVKYWLLVISTILVNVGLDYLEILIDPQSFDSDFETIISVKTLLIRMFFSIICTASITMIFTRFIQYFFNNQLQTATWGIAWTKRETSIFIVLLKFNLPFHAFYFMLPKIVSNHNFLIYLIISIYYYIFLVLAVILAVFLDKTPIRSALVSIRRGVWEIMKSSLLYFPFLLILIFSFSFLLENHPILSFKIEQFIIAPLFISFVCSLFRITLAKRTQYAKQVNENSQIIDTFVQISQASSWAICKRSFSFFFLEIPKFFIRNWLLVISTILMIFGANHLGEFLYPGTENREMFFSTKDFFTRLILLIVYMLIITMLLVRFIQYFFNNKIQRGKYWGIEWSKRETTTFIMLLKFGLLLQLLHFSLINILSFDVFVWFSSWIGPWIWPHIYIIMGFALIFSISLDKTPIRSALNCIKGKIWKMFKALFSFYLVFFPFFLPLFLFLTNSDSFSSPDIWVQKTGHLILMIITFIFCPLFISFCCALFQGIISEEIKKRVIDGMSN